MKYFFYRASTLLVALLFLCLQANAQFRITGTVSDEGGETLIGVSILVKGTTRGTISDIDGNYAIEVPGSTAVIEFSYTGFKSETVEVTPDNK